MKKLSILGSTGSIGVQTLEIVDRFPDRFEVAALGAGRNIALMKEQIVRFRPRVVSVLSEEIAETLSRQVSEPVEILHGIEGLIRVATLDEVTLVVSALVGAIGLVPTLSAIKTGKTIALANKESLVMGGKIVMEEAQKRGVAILPIDSEHSAIFQSLVGHQKKDLSRIILTASGGPFLNYPVDRLRDAPPEEALKHPRWDMGKKVTIDSATLMNKGLEIIEAHWLFDVPIEKIDVHVHPQSVVHSMVEYIDGAVVAQLGIADMRIPISYALAYPDRLNLTLPALDFFETGQLTFLPPDPDRFPCLELAKRAISIGETMPAVLNAANEVAVDAYLRRKIRFAAIPELVEMAMTAHQVHPVMTAEDVLKADQWAREKARTLLPDS